MSLNLQHPMPIYAPMPLRPCLRMPPLALQVGHALAYLGPKDKKIAAKLVVPWNEEMV